MKINFAKIKAFLIDLDGTLYFQGKPIAGAADTIENLRENACIIRFPTNTDSRTNEFLQEKLERFGFAINSSEVYTPLTASITFMKSQKNKTCYPLVSDEVFQEYKELTIDECTPDYVIIGDCRDKVSYVTLNNVFRMISKKTELIALQKGKFFLNEEGKNLDTGSFVSLFEYATDKKAMVLGKPNLEFFSIFLNELQLLPEEVVIIGDDITTDIQGAKNIGAHSILLKTGKFNQKEVSDSNIHPDMILESIADLDRYI
ncbi:MAG: TIGR01458 family HAD-type hydrolase [Euryarchaeota archaeon]|nr:TIGR01458 family HAD-type hydrolase [Euryarchaeota archaeon]